MKRVGIRVAKLFTTFYVYTYIHTHVHGKIKTIAKIQLLYLFMERKISKLESVIVMTTYSNSIEYGNHAEKHV